MNNKKYILLMTAIVFFATVSTKLQAVITNPATVDIEQPIAAYKTISFLLYSPVLGNNHMEVPATWTVGDLKQHISQEYKIPVQKQIIYFGSAEQISASKPLKEAIDKKLTILMKTEAPTKKF